jgi:hypothetical protein
VQIGPGCLIQSQNRMFGTLGALATLSGWPNRVLALTASHVLATGATKFGDPVCVNKLATSPVQDDQDAGIVYAFTPLVAAASVTADIGLAWLDCAVLGAPGTPINVPGLGQLAGVSSGVRRGDRLSYAGAVSGLVTGVQVLEVGEDAPVPVNDDSGSITYKSHILCEQTCSHGDSGAVLLDSSGRVAGMLVAIAQLSDGNQYDVVTPIDNVINHPIWAGQVLAIITSLPEMIEDAAAPR